MRRVPAWMVAALCVAALTLAMGATSHAQDNELEATIAALETVVAQQATRIATLTLSPTPQSTLPAGPTRSATPVRLSDDYTLTSYLLAETESDLYAFVDIQNMSDHGVVSPIVEMSFFDRDGNLLGQESLSSLVHWAPPGGHIPMSGCCILDGAYSLDEIGDVKIDVVPNTYYTLEEVDASNLQIQGVPIEGTGERVSGKIYNGGEEPVSKIIIVFAEYDSSGVLVGNCYSYLDITIPPKKSARFNIGAGCFNVDYGKSASKAGGPYTYRLFVSRSR